MNNFPDDVLAHVLHFVTSHRDRNAVSLVCKLWCKVEGFNRERVLVGNGDAISPERVIRRFPRLKSLTLKGKPYFADLNFQPHDLEPWIEALAKRGIGLEELRLKRILVSDESLKLVSRCFANFKSLVLVSCEGFTSHGLKAIAANCRFLRELDLQGIEIDGLSGHWLSSFPESCTSLTSLNFACLEGKINLVALVRLVARSPNLKSLKLNRAVPPQRLQKILMQAPQLVDLGIGSMARIPNKKAFEKLETAFQNCKSIRNLSGFFEIDLCLLLYMRPILSNLTSLNLRCVPAPTYGAELKIMIDLCVKLQRLWVLDLIGDGGLEVVASTCKELQELRVFSSNPSGDGDGAVTERGLVAISSGCPKLHSLVYSCGQMTNAGLETLAKNCPNLIRFRLCILDPRKPEPLTMQPLDEGFGAIVRSCKRLRRLSVSGLLTDQVLIYMGMYAEQLEMLSIAFARGTDKGMLNVLNGCKKLRKLEIRDSPFGDEALLKVEKCETLRSLWMTSCEVTVGGRDILAEKMQSFNMEMDVETDILDLDETGGVELKDGQKVEKMYLYRALDLPSNDAPEFV